MYAQVDQGDNSEMKPIHWRNGLVTRDGRVAGDVSANNDYYHVIQYDQILDALGDEIQRQGVEPFGEVTFSRTGHKMTGEIYFDDEEATIEPSVGDELKVGLNVRAGHSGHMGLHYDAGQYRVVCSNGLVAWDSQLGLSQTHSEPFQPDLAYQSVKGSLQSADRVEERMQEAQDTYLRNQDEARLLLHDLGLEEYVANPEADIAAGMIEEFQDTDRPSLYDVYQAATYALTHHADPDTPQHILNRGYEQAGQLLDMEGDLPDPDEVMEGVVADRLNYHVEEPDGEEYFSGEREIVREVADARNVA